MVSRINDPKVTDLNNYAISTDELATALQKSAATLSLMGNTIDEAAAYTGVGSRKIRQLTDNERCPFVLWNGSKRLIKREEFVEFIKKQYSI